MTEQETALLAEKDALLVRAAEIEQQMIEFPDSAEALAEGLQKNAVRRAQITKQLNKLKR